ncbi:MAG: hypothetical protein AB7V43_12460 [Acidimicrobiia bacterium]
MESRPSLWRSRWAAVGAAVAVTLGAGGLVFADAAPSSGPGSTGSYHAVTPQRILNTRPGSANVGGITGPVGPDAAITLTVAGVSPVPANAIAVVLNVTAADTTAGSFLTVYPSDAASRPDASNLNWVSGDVVPNLVTVALSADGKVSFYNYAGNVNVIADVAGYYTASNDKVIQLPLTGLALENAAFDNPLPGGVRMADNAFGSYASFNTAFDLPQDYTAGTPISVNIRWVVNGACTVAFQANNLTVTRPGIAQITGPATSSGNSIATATSTSANVVVETKATIVSPDATKPLQPGDSINVGYFRRGDAVSDTCAGLTAIITGLSATYA